MDINAAYCVTCNELIQSKFRHDFVWCKGKHVAVDGGKDYQKITFTNGHDYYIVQLVKPFEDEKVKES